MFEDRNGAWKARIKTDHGKEVLLEIATFIGPRRLEDLPARLAVALGRMVSSVLYTMFREDKHAQ